MYANALNKKKLSFTHPNANAFNVSFTWESFSRCSSTFDFYFKARENLSTYDLHTSKTICIHFLVLIIIIIIIIWNAFRFVSFLFIVLMGSHCEFMTLVFLCCCNCCFLRHVYERRCVKVLFQRIKRRETKNQFHFQGRSKKFLFFPRMSQ